MNSRSNWCWTAAKRPRHYYEGESDVSVEASKRRRVVELSPPRSSDMSSTRHWTIRTRHHKQMSKTSRFITDTEDNMSASEDEGRLNDSDEEFTLGRRPPAARKQPRRRSPPHKSRSTVIHYVLWQSWILIWALVVHLGN